MTYMLSFNEEEISRLEDSMKFCGYESYGKIKKDYTTLFDYSRFLKTYNYKAINLTIFRWFMNFTVLNYYNTQKDKIICNFCPLFHQLIINRCNNIEQFTINLDSFIKPKVTSTKNFADLEALLLPLKGFEKKLLKNLTLHCSNLKGINFSTTNNEPIFVENFCTIIQKQKKLEEFITQHLFNDKIISSLEYQKQSLISIELSCVDFSEISLDNFIDLHNLKFLKFSNCSDDDPLRRYDILQSASFKLQKLEFRSNHWDESVEPMLIKYLGPSLTSLSIHSTVTVPIVKKLIINIPLSFGTYTSEMITRLANNLSISTDNITLKFLNHDRAKSLHFFKTFFENAHSHLRKIGSFEYNWNEKSSFIGC
uniref:Uncharacterized protein n=1 Tax=Rhizophagus irregularis (strain DAOM 181602 / DAOM 197198 / MUCL 43194) TaxID=747089 RepID=U9T7R2_RHIID